MLPLAHVILFELYWLVAFSWGVFLFIYQCLCLPFAILFVPLPLFYRRLIFAMPASRNLVLVRDKRDPKKFKCKFCPSVQRLDNLRHHLFVIHNKGIHQCPRGIYNIIKPSETTRERFEERALARNAKVRALRKRKRDAKASATPAAAASANAVSVGEGSSGA